MTLRALNYGNYGIFLIMGSAGFCPSTVLGFSKGALKEKGKRVLLRNLGSMDAAVHAASIE